MSDLEPPRFDLARFVAAQAAAMPAVWRELGAGHKQTHWMWFVFPQLRGLGQSPTALHYGLDGRAEAAAFLAHDVLGPRLIACVERVNAVAGRTALQIFGSPDDLKFRSCLTLFAALRPAPFTAALARYYGGEPDPRTLAMLAGAAPRRG